MFLHDIDFFFTLWMSHTNFHLKMQLYISKIPFTYPVHCSTFLFRQACPSWASQMRTVAADSKYLLPDTAQQIHCHTYSYLIRISPFAEFSFNYLSFSLLRAMTTLTVHHWLAIQAICPVICFAQSPQYQWKHKTPYSSCQELLFRNQNVKCAV